MINIDLTPCGTCEHYIKVFQPDGTESTEYIGCEIAEKLNAKNLLKQKGLKLSCDKYVEEE